MTIAALDRPDRSGRSPYPASARRVAAPVARREELELKRLRCGELSDAGIFIGTVAPAVLIAWAQVVAGLLAGFVAFGMPAPANPLLLVVTIGVGTAAMVLLALAAAALNQDGAVRGTRHDPSAPLLPGAGRAHYADAPLPRGTATRRVGAAADRPRRPGAARPDRDHARRRRSRTGQVVRGGAGPGSDPDSLVPCCHVGHPSPVPVGAPALMSSQAGSCHPRPQRDEHATGCGTRCGSAARRVSPEKPDTPPHRAEGPRTPGRQSRTRCRAARRRGGIRLPGRLASCFTAATVRRSGHRNSTSGRHAIPILPAQVPVGHGPLQQPRTPRWLA